MAVLLKPIFFLSIQLLVPLLCLQPGPSPFVAAFVQSSSRNETDHLALLAFKAAISSDPFGALNSWNESAHFCQWVGVTCGRRHHQRVTKLDLDHNKLSGSIPPHIGNLSFLRALWLRNNSLTGEIPPQLARLHRLQRLSLLNNSISGEIPGNLSACSSLVVLEFTGNRLTGGIPEEFGSLSLLEELYVGENNLAGGLPSTLGNLSSLTTIFAAENKISGSLPDSLGQWRHLEKLLLGSNNLVGIIPLSMYNISSIVYIDLGGNQIEGSLPLNLGITLPDLQIFVVGRNKFTGPIPSTLSNATNLGYLALARNGFTGRIPSLENLQNLEQLILEYNHLGTGEMDDLSFFDTLANASGLSVVALAYNSFGGVLPESISNLSIELAFFSLGVNNVHGNIPSGIGNLINLQTLALSTNNISGTIPSGIGKLQKLQSLTFLGNKLQGEIPPSFANLTLLLYFDLSENYLHGNIPAYIGKYHFLLRLGLDHNHLSGIIPKEVGSLSSLLQLDLGYNNLSGPIPQEIGQLQNLEELDVSRNMLTGNIPSSLGGCVKLTSLNMGGNKLWGILPSSLAALRGMEELDLSQNNFSGKIPDYLSGFIFLNKLNLSFNDFDGPIPEKGVFKNATAISIEGNKKLCGGIAELQIQSCNSKVSSKNKGLTLTMKLITSISLGLLGLLLLLCFLYVYRSKKTINLPSVKLFGNSFLQLSYQSLLKATDGFSSTNLIGVGGFGSVYKGILGEGQKVVAVKVLNLQFRGASKSFLAECKALKNIKHRNLVKILTACASIDYQGNDFKALIYEFMVNGSLEQWLHPNNTGDDGHEEESRRLNFLQRLNIAIDVASALDYLHHHCSEPIVHCDLKPSNILLDDEMIAHVGDFGLARFLLEATSKSSPNQSSSIGMRGTVGYAAPEYGMGNEVSEYGDVYSYGILLLEMFTGKRPTDSMFTDSLTLHKFVEMALLEQVENICDPTLFLEREMGEERSITQITDQNHSSYKTNKIQDCLVSILKIAVACSHDLPTDRMGMKDVVAQLHAIKKSMLQNGARRGQGSTIVVG